MIFDLWTILLIAAASQSLLLIVFFCTRKPANKQARALLLALLGIVFAIIISNIISSSYLYRQLPQISGFARGMVLLLGPLLYLYSLVMLTPHFKLRPLHLLHLLPYLVGLIIIKIQMTGVPDELTIAAIDALMEGTIQMNGLLTLWFVSYFLHLLIYMGITRTVIKRTISDDANTYSIPIEKRLSLLNKMSFQFALITFLFLGISAYCIITETYTITGNFLYTLVLSSLVFTIAYQAVGDYELLVPGFILKYRTGAIDNQQRSDLLTSLTRLFEEEKVFTNPDLKVSSVASQLETSPHIISQLINTQLDKTFSEFLNEYRIKEFKERVSQPDYTKYSIIAIAFDVGFNSKTAFNTTFKKQTGLTPSAYIKSVLHN